MLLYRISFVYLYRSINPIQMENIQYENLKQLEADVKRQVPTDVLKRLNDFVFKNLYQILDSRFDNRFGKKATAFITGRGFAYKIDDCFMAYSASMNKMYKGHVMVVCALYPISTPLGKIYVECTEGRIDCYTGHYFDQYAIRTGLAQTTSEANMKCESVIKTWLQKEIVETRTKIHGLENYKSDGYTMYKYHPDGMGLGVLSENVQLFKTFVSTEMLRNKQITLNTQLASEPTQLEAMQPDHVSKLIAEYNARIFSK